MNQSTATPKSDFLPNLCSTYAVLSLVLLGELLALALELASNGIGKFDWSHFGAVSLLSQWIILPSAGPICLLRPWFRKQSGAVAGSVCFAIVLFVSLVFSSFAVWMDSGFSAFDVYQVITNLCITAIFSGILLRYLYLQQELSDRKRAELQARVEALQARIRPHFLFNSLNSIVSLIESDPSAAEKLVLDLSSLFRSSLQLSGKVLLSQEVAMCQRFLNIEKFRLGNRLQVEWKIGEIPSNTEILNLLLQPLLENAIYHGIQPLPEGGTVLIEIHTVKNDIVVKITNPFRSEDLRKPDDELPSQRGNGIALSNIRHRLESNYGDKAHLRLVKGATEFTVILRYPLGEPAAP